MALGADRRADRRAAVGAVVLGFESVVVFLAGLVVFGLKVLPTGIADWWGVVGGTILAVLMVLAARFTGSRAGIVVGWVLQAVLLAAGSLVPAIFVVGLIFGGMWAYATIKGAQLDRRNAALRPPPDQPGPAEEETP